MFRCGFPCPGNYNPVDHYIQMLAVIPGEEENSKKRIGIVCQQFDQSELGLQLEQSASVLPDRNEQPVERGSPYKVFPSLLIFKLSNLYI
jgi:hypothetical protein